MKKIKVNDEGLGKNLGIAILCFIAALIVVLVVGEVDPFSWDWFLLGMIAGEVIVMIVLSWTIKYKAEEIEEVK